MSTVNRVVLIGEIEKAPTQRADLDGRTQALFTLVTTVVLKGREGQTRERKDWHRVLVKDTALAERCSELEAGVRVYVEGRLATRKYQKDGIDHYLTEVVCPPFQSRIVPIEPGEDDPDITKGDMRAFRSSGSTGARPADLDDWVDM